MIYLITLCIATCTQHTVTAYGADGFGHAFYIEGHRIEVRTTAVSLNGNGARFDVADEVFRGGFES